MSRTDDNFPAHPGRFVPYALGRIPERDITQEGVQQHTGPLFRVSVSETESTGTCTVVIVSDAADLIDPTGPVTYEVDTVPHAPTTHPVTGIIGTYTYLFDKDPKHPILISPVIHLKDGTAVRPGSETFDFDTASNVISVSLADKTSTVVTATVQFDTDTALGTAKGRYKIGGGGYTTFNISAVAPIGVGSFDVTLTSGQQTVTIGGQNLTGVWGPEVVITISAADASGGPSLDVKVLHGSPTAGESTITWIGSGTLVSINGATATTPGASPWVISRPLAGLSSDAYTFIGSRNGQTVQDTIFIPAVDQDTVAPDVSLAVSSSTATTITYDMVVTNPSGGAAAFVTVYAYYCSLTFNGSTYTNTSVGGSFGTGTSYPIVVTKPTAGNPTYSGATATLRVRAIISGGGGEEISRTIPDQAATAGTPASFSAMSCVLDSAIANTALFSWTYTGPTAAFYLSVMDIDGTWHQNFALISTGATSYTFFSAFNLTTNHADPSDLIAFQLSAYAGNTILATSTVSNGSFNHNP